MLCFLTDEDFNGRVVRGLRRRFPSLDLLRVQEAGLSGQHDRVVLEWAAKECRLMLTHDAATMTKYAVERIQAGLPMPGIVEVGQELPIGLVIDELTLLATASFEGEWENQILYLPLR